MSNQDCQTYWIHLAHWTTTYKEALQLYNDGNFTGCIDSAKRNLLNPELCDYARMRNLMLLANAFPYDVNADWYDMEYYRCLAEECYYIDRGRFVRTEDRWKKLNDKLRLEFDENRRALDAWRTYSDQKAPIRITVKQPNGGGHGRMDTEVLWKAARATSEPRPSRTKSLDEARKAVAVEQDAVEGARDSVTISPRTRAASRLLSQGTSKSLESQQRAKMEQQARHDRISVTESEIIEDVYPPIQPTEKATHSAVESSPSAKRTNDHAQTEPTAIAGVSEMHLEPTENSELGDVQSVSVPAELLQRMRQEITQAAAATAAMQNVLDTHKRDMQVGIERVQTMLQAFLNTELGLLDGPVQVVADEPERVETRD